MNHKRPIKATAKDRLLQNQDYCEIKILKILFFLVGSYRELESQANPFLPYSLSQCLKLSLMSIKSDLQKIRNIITSENQTFRKSRKSGPFKIRLLEKLEKLFLSDDFDVLSSRIFFPQVKSLLNFLHPKTAICQHSFLKVCTTHFRFDFSAF